jgi:hypothetical protein
VTARAATLLTVLVLGVSGCTGGSADRATEPSNGAQTGAGATSAGGTTAGAGLSDPSVLPELRSGLRWRSGVYLPGSSRSRVQSFGTWRGRQVDVVIDWPNRATWNDVVNPGWLYNLWENTPYTKVFGVAMLPEQDASATMQRCAAGEYDGRWREFGRVIAARGFERQTIVRLGWEFNGDWYKWAAWDPTAFVNCWRHVVTAVRTQAPRLRFDWTVNRGEGRAVADARRAYPGDAYVDVVGVDSYDAWPGATTESTWQEHYSGPYGLKFWADFATAHHRPLSVPEWGVFPGTTFRGHNGGDNAFYVTKMTEFFRDNAGRLAYEAYFDESAGYYGGAIFDPVQNPRASAAYLKVYRP